MRIRVSGKDAVRVRVGTRRRDLLWIGLVESAIGLGAEVGGVRSPCGREAAAGDVVGPSLSRIRVRVVQVEE